MRCLAPLAGVVAVEYLPEYRRGKLNNLMVCRSPWMCPLCASLISERRRSDLQAMTRAARGKDLRVVMITLTFSHRRADVLSDVLERLLAAVRAMMSHRTYQSIKARYAFVGFTKALEVTWGQANGWHPHCHILLYLPIEEDDMDSLAHALRVCWVAALRHQGLTCNDHGFRLDDTNQAVADYVAKFGHERSWDEAAELTKSHIKRGRAGSLTPWDLLRMSADGDKQASALFVQYAQSFKGRSQVRSTPRLRELLLGAPERSDEDLLEDSDTLALLLALVTPQGWRQVCHAGARASIQLAADSADGATVHQALLDAGVNADDIRAMITIYKGSLVPF